MKQNWEKQFDETKFAKGGGCCFECCDYEGMYLDLKSFIASQRQQAVIEVLEKIKLRKKSINKKYSTDERRYPHGYNQAIDDIKTQITNLLR